MAGGNITSANATKPAAAASAPTIQGGGAVRVKRRWAG